LDFFQVTHILSFLIDEGRSLLKFSRLLPKWHNSPQNMRQTAGIMTFLFQAACALFTKNNSGDNTPFTSLLLPLGAENHSYATSVKGRWYPTAGKVTVGLAPHWLCVTNFSGLSSCRLAAQGKKSLHSLLGMAHFTLP